MDILRPEGAGMECRDKRGALAASRHVPAAKIGNNRDSRYFGQQSWIVQLQRVPEFRPVPDCLSMATQRDNPGWRHASGFQQQARRFGVQPRQSLG